MLEDYIVDEVRRIREEQASKHGFDIMAILAAAKRRQRKSGRPVVSFARRKKPQSGRSTRAPEKGAADGA